MSNEATFIINDGEIKVSGYIDRYSVSGLIKQIKLEHIGCKQLSLDLSDVKKVDTAGLAWILKVIAQAEQAGQSVKLNEVPPQLLNLAQISGVEQLLV